VETILYGPFILRKAWNKKLWPGIIPFTVDGPTTDMTFNKLPANQDQKLKQ
jgi:hypothetical protein